MSEAFEKWWVENWTCKVCELEGADGYDIETAFEAGQNQAHEEVNDLNRKLYLEGVKNNSDRARTEFLEGKLKEMEEAKT